ncbi:mycofactocin system GMC family oxidoreductase MftG [Gordonia sp. (in: high G+C Gram-positive bacteria)]|uniref:mycofactocin system GMC family oxidoreductase MftG n=1 Tax=Gordonia sp. (in: high G+C Gram-positive bacteria) TaxID=84139 RepID=UPI0026352323|nr:mycofactocin system GMC family oxidoreductase MftG [Gordonia sp. (in: high G+C Gram-positive bacteria)]
MSPELPRSADVVVVGAGTAGALVAARLAERGDRSVLLVERGPVEPPGPETTMLRRLPLGDPVRAAAIPEAGGRPVVRGRGLGGSSAINGGYFLRPHLADFADWPQWWTPERLGAGYRAVEELLGVSEFADDELGDVPRTFEEYWSADAGARLLPDGRPATTEQHATGESGTAAEWARPGLLRVRSNRRDGRRVTTAEALASAEGRAPATLSLAGEAPVDEVLVRGGRVTGVRIGADVVTAGAVILSAGTLGTAALLARSGVLAGLGLDSLVPQEHAERIVRFAPRHPVSAPALLQSVVHADDGIEIRCYGDDFASFIDGVPSRGIPVGVTDLAHAAAGSWRDGRLDLGAPDAASLARMERWVSVVSEMLSSPEFGELVVPGSVEVDPVVGMSQHASGTLPLGVLVDPLGGVPGVAGLRVVDGSVLPPGLASGPHATIAMLGWVIGGAIE